MTPLAIALGVVGLAAVLAAWHTARAWLRVRETVADVEVVRSEMRARLDAMASVGQTQAATLADLEKRTAEAHRLALNASNAVQGRRA